MAITTLDGLIAGFAPAGEDVIKAAFTGEAAGQYHSMMYVAGRPGAAVAPSPGLAGAALTTYAGQIPVPPPVGGENIYLARMEFSQAANIAGVTLVDRLWHNSGFTITTTTAQTVNSVAWPARDQDGSTNGNGVMVAIEVSALTGGGAISNTTLQYTNSTATGGARTGTIASFPASAQPGTWVPFNLQAGDVGVRSIQSLTLGTSYVSGTVHLVAYREMTSLGTVVANATSSAGPIDLAMPRVYDNSVLQFVYTLSGTAAGISNGQVFYAQG